MHGVFPIPAFRDNYIWLIRRDNNAAVVDPGEAAPVLDHLARFRLRLVAILNTHHHHDHVGGNAGLLAHFQVPVYAPRNEPVPGATDKVGEGARVAIPELSLRLEVLDIPGHTAGHIAYYGADSLFCGDTLFGCGCGRLFEGTPAQMHASLRKLADLPGTTRVYCGHEYTLDNIRFAKTVDPVNRALIGRERADARARARGAPTLPSTVLLEKRTNPFLRCHEPALIEAARRLSPRPVEHPVEVFAVLRRSKDVFR